MLLEEPVRSLFTIPLALTALVAFLATLVVTTPASARGKKSAAVDSARATVQLHAAKPTPTPRRTERAPAAAGLPPAVVLVARVPEPVRAPHVAPKTAPSPTRARAALMVFLN